MSKQPEDKTGIELIAEERKRQIDVEGWTAEHDSGHEDQSIAIAASLYAMPSYCRDNNNYDIDACDLIDRLWPWGFEWWKPAVVGPSVNDNLIGRIKELTKSGALIAAEIDRLQNLKP